MSKHFDQRMQTMLTDLSNINLKMLPYRVKALPKSDERRLTVHNCNFYFNLFAAHVF